MIYVAFKILKFKILYIPNSKKLTDQIIWQTHNLDTSYNSHIKHQKAITVPTLKPIWLTPEDLAMHAEGTYTSSVINISTNLSANIASGFWGSHKLNLQLKYTIENKW